MKHTILLVEDDILQAEMFLDLFGDHYNVDTVASLSGLLVNAQLIEYDLILLDVNLSYFNSIDAIRNTVNPVNLPIVYISAIEDSKLQVQEETDYPFVSKYDLFSDSTIDKLDNYIMQYKAKK